ncbi:MAG: hypothetical protein FWG72_08850 [Oscillospiraceae bacterium]|nr:hypothetical protein [Oscillospiraceae bacterium]
MELLGFTNWHDEKYHAIDDQLEEDMAYEITVQHMRRHGYRFTGNYHQYGKYGTPYFDTNQKLCLSMRGWGSLMAQVLELPEDISENLGLDMSYCHWAWFADSDEEVLPAGNTTLTSE